MIPATPPVPRAPIQYAPPKVEDYSDEMPDYVKKQLAELDILDKTLKAVDRFCDSIKNGKK